MALLNCSVSAKWSPKSCFPTGFFLKSNLVKTIFGIEGGKNLRFAKFGEYFF